MQENDKIILDQFEEEPVKRWFQHWSIVFGPLILFAVGLLFRVQKWPFANLLLAISMVLILIRAFILFLSTKRKAYEWFYFVSRIVLIAVLALEFGWGNLNPKLMPIALSIFAVGVVLFVIKRKKTPDSEEQREEDY